MVATNVVPLIQFGVDSSMQSSAQITLINALISDSAVTAIGNSAVTGYPVRAGATLVTAGAAGTGVTLPSTTSAMGQGGQPVSLGLYIAVAGTAPNPAIVYPSPGDVGATINGQPSVILYQNTVTAFQCFPPGLWFADGIGTGASGSIGTIVSQGTLAAAGTNQGNAAPITQAMVNVTATAATQGVILPPSQPGLQITINGGGGGAASFHLYGSGSDTINGTPGSTGIAITNPSAAPTIAYCFSAGAWFTK